MGVHTAYLFMFFSRDYFMSVTLSLVTQLT